MNLYEQIGEENIDKLIDTLYGEVIANDSRINFLFTDGFERIKTEQKKFFRMFLGEPGHSVFNVPNLKQKHSILPISKEEAKYWFEDFEIALEKIEMSPAVKTFLSKKINMLASQMINTVKNK